MLLIVGHNPTLSQKFINPLKVHEYDIVCQFKFTTLSIYQKYLEMEDAVEGEKKAMQDKLESLESVVRMLELKAKNSADHGNIFFF